MDETPRLRARARLACRGPGGLGPPAERGGSRRGLPGGVPSSRSRRAQPPGADAAEPRGSRRDDGGASPRRCRGTRSRSSRIRRPSRRSASSARRASDSASSPTSRPRPGPISTGRGSPRCATACGSRRPSGSPSRTRRSFGVALDAWALPPARVAYVGDRPDNDVAPAKKLGLTAVRLRRGPHADQAARTDAERADVEAADLDGRRATAWSRGARRSGERVRRTGRANVQHHGRR